MAASGCVAGAAASDPGAHPNITAAMAIVAIRTASPEIPLRAMAGMTGLPSLVRSGIGRLHTQDE
jgi:hypothetical protein